jgi:pSer/pThr/pTyr-binding forkhead associated (FHA) protein
MDVQLTIVDHYAKKTQVALLRLPAVLGRDEHADVHLIDPWASHRHCTLSEVEGTLVVTDLASKNGVFMHGHRISQSQVLPGDQINIGQTEITVYYQRHVSPAIETNPSTLDTQGSPSPEPVIPPPDPETRDLLYGIAASRAHRPLPPEESTP